MRCSGCGAAVRHAEPRRRRRVRRACVTEWCRREPVAALPSVTEHPGPRRRGVRHPTCRRLAAAASARMRRAAPRLVGAALIDGGGTAQAGIDRGEMRRGQQGAGRQAAAAFARLRPRVVAHRTLGGERSAGRAEIVVGRHGYRSAASGMATPPLMPPLGPSAPGLMSNSKMPVGSQRVAQEFGMSTTPLMWPCTGAVPRMA